MDFQTFYSILSKRISDNADVPTFVKNLIAMITDLPEDEWGTKKDPSKRVSDSTYRNFSKRGINKTTAKTIVYRLTPENFMDSLLSYPPATLEVLAEDILPFEPTASKDNIADILANIFVDIIRTTAGLTSSDKLEEQKQLQQSFNLKNKYGKHLLKECENHCAMTGCGKILFVSKDSKTSEVYEISRIDKKKTDQINNLIALCPQCFTTYQLDSGTKKMKELKTTKKYLSNKMESILELNAIELEKGLTSVISQISKLKQEELSKLTMNPSELHQKINPEENMFLYNQIKMAIVTYFMKIDEIMINLDKRKLIDFEDLQYQMRSLYKKLRKSKKTELEIFNAISEKLHRVTLQDTIFCQVIVCYFIQRCEVFDATS